MLGMTASGSTRQPPATACCVCLFTAAVLSAALSSSACYHSCSLAWQLGSYMSRVKNRAAAGAVRIVSPRWIDTHARSLNKCNVQAAEPWVQGVACVSGRWRASAPACAAANQVISKGAGAARHHAIAAAGDTSLLCGGGAVQTRACGCAAGPGARVASRAGWVRTQPCTADGRLGAKASCCRRGAQQRLRGPRIALLSCRQVITCALAAPKLSASFHPAG